jgi:hypothetical protein
MRYREIQARPATTDAHPFVTDITIAPTSFDDFERAIEQRDDVRLLCRVDGPNSWLVHVGCSSAMVRQTIQDAWG